MPNYEQTIVCLKQWVEVAMHLSMRNFMLYAKENNLSMSQIGTLFHLHSKGMMGVTDVAEHLGVTSAAASQMIERLVQQNLIERTEAPNDRRVRQLKLTEEGKAVLQSGIYARQSWMDRLVDTLSPAEQEQVIHVLHLLVERTQLISSQPPTSPKDNH